MRQVCLNARDIVDDLQRCTTAQLRATPRGGSRLRSFRTFDRLQVVGTPGLSPYRPLPRLLRGLAHRLAHVTRLDLRFVPYLTDDCLAHAAACMPLITELSIADARLDGLDQHTLLLGPRGARSASVAAAAAAASASAPDRSFFWSLCHLRNLTTLVGVAPADEAELQGLAFLTGLTRLELRGDHLMRQRLTALSRLTSLRRLSLPYTGGVYWEEEDVDYDGEEGDWFEAGKMTWVSSLVYLEELLQCPPMCEADFGALGRCQRLRSISFRDMDDYWSHGLHATPEHVAEYSLPGVEEVSFEETVDVGSLQGFLRQVSLPGLKVLHAVLHMGNGTPAADCFKEVAEVVRRLPISVFKLLLGDESLLQKRALEHAAWSAELLALLGGLKELLAGAGRSVVLDIEHAQYTTY